MNNLLSKKYCIMKLEITLKNPLCQEDLTFGPTETGPKIASPKVFQKKL